MNFSSSDLNEMRLFYQEELDKTVKRLQHIKNVLTSIGVSAVHHIENAYSDLVSHEKKASVKTRKSKRGPKAKWEGMIMDILKKLDRTLTYEELTSEIMKQEGLEESKRANTKTAIAAVISRLKKRKIRAFSAGIKEKYIGLSRWFDENGQIKRGYMPDVQAKVKSPAAPKTVAKEKTRKPALKTVATKTVKAAKSVASNSKAPIKKRQTTVAAKKPVVKASTPTKKLAKPAKKPLVKSSVTPKAKVSAKKTPAAKPTPVAKTNATIKVNTTKKLATPAKKTPAKAKIVAKTATKSPAAVKASPATVAKKTVKGATSSKAKTPAKAKI